MKVIMSERLILSHNEATILLHAHEILEKMAERSGDADVVSLACAITDCLDVLAQCYEKEDF